MKASFLSWLMAGTLHKDYGKQYGREPILAAVRPLPTYVFVWTMLLHMEIIGFRFHSLKFPQVEVGLNYMPRAYLPPSKRHKTNYQGRLPFEPTDAHYRMVEKLAPILKVEEICAIIGISVPTFYKYFKPNVELGRAMANAIVGQKAFDLAVKGNVPMVKHWTETRMGWVIPKDAVASPDESPSLESQTKEALEQEAAELAKRRLALTAPDDDDDEQQYHATNGDRFGEAGSHGAEAAD